MDHAVPAPFPLLPREEALARAAQNDAALHRAMRERGEELIPARHAQYLVPVDRCEECRRVVTTRDPLAIDVARGLLYCAGCR